MLVGRGIGMDMGTAAGTAVDMAAGTEPADIDERGSDEMDLLEPGTEVSEAVHGTVEEPC